MPGSARDRVRDEIVAVLRGEVIRPADVEEFTAAALRHRVVPLLARAGMTTRLPSVQAACFIEEINRQQGISEVRDRAIARVIAALHAAGVDALLFKGAYLAYACYPASYLRIRADTGLLVRERDRERATAVIGELDYRRQALQTTDAVLGHASFEAAGDPPIVIHVHWRAAEPLLAAALFDVDALYARAVPVPRVSPQAKGLRMIDALALACVHQAAQHVKHDLLLWTYDLHLLLAALSPAQVDEFVTAATERRITRICLSAIEPVSAAFGTPATRTLVERLRAVTGHEPSAALIHPRRRIDDLLMDLSVLRSWPGRIRLLGAHLFPPAAYMRQKYPRARTEALPWLYVRRVASGTRGWFANA